MARSVKAAAWPQQAKVASLQTTVSRKAGVFFGLRRPCLRFLRRGHAPAHRGLRLRHACAHVHGRLAVCRPAWRGSVTAAAWPQQAKVASRQTTISRKAGGVFGLRPAAGQGCVTADDGLSRGERLPWPAPPRVTRTSASSTPRTAGGSRAGPEQSDSRCGIHGSP